MARTSLPHKLLAAALLFLSITGILVLRRATADPLLQSVAGGIHPSAVKRYQSDACSNEKKRVAVIGAGAAGSSAAYFIQEIGGGCFDVEIDVFERNDYIGGRSTTVNAYGDSNIAVELGASIFVEVNHNLVAASKRFNLSTSSFGAPVLSSSDDDVDPDRFGVWDGQTFTFTQPADESYWRTVLRMLWKYGLSPIRTQSLMKSTVGKFLQLYGAPYFPFESLSEAVYAVGLTEVTSQRGSDFLTANGITPPFATDLIQASTRVNYAQNLDQLHGVEAMVCMATDGAMAIAGGNWRIFEGMLTHSGAHVHLNVSAQSIDFLKDGSGYSVTVSGSDGSDSQIRSYDDVVIATPYQFSGLKLPSTLSRVPDSIEYVQLQVTLFTTPHRLQPQYFGKQSAAEVPGTILTTLPNNAEGDGNGASSVGPRDFFSVSTLAQVVNPTTQKVEFLYKIFSRERVSADLLQRLFLGNALAEGEGRKGDGVTTWKYEKLWHSYPYLPPRVTFEEPVLAPGLWYTAGIESFISTMETSSLMGMNVAQLLVNRWAGLTSALEGSEPSHDEKENTKTSSASEHIGVSSVIDESPEQSGGGYGVADQRDANGGDHVVEEL